jgi:selenium metabolism protein YedF
MKQIDCRGLNCPLPVIRTKKALEEYGDEQIKVILDNNGSLQNVKRFASSQGRDIDLVEKDGVFELLIKPGVDIVEKTSHDDSYVVLITSQTLGEGDDKLGAILMNSFLNTLWDNDNLPAKILFLNSAVKLACEGSDALDTLKLLNESGVSLVSCGTCLAFYEITEKLKVGHAGNMYEVLESLLDSTKVIKI